MPDKPPRQAGDFFAIPGIATIALDGPDAVAFAQAQFMNDVAALAPGHWQWNGWLTPKGRVVALFALLRMADASLLLLLLDADPADVAARLQRFVFRSKVGIHVRTGLAAAGAFIAPDEASGNRFAGTADTGITLDAGTAHGARSLRLGPAAMDDPASAGRWLAFDLAHGLPRLPASQAEAWTPQQLSLDRLGAYSVRKGCYPGQEIVARTHFLGQAKRGLVRLKGPGVASPGEVMAGEAPTAATAGARPVGQLVCSEADEGLAVMSLDVGDGPFSAGGQACVRLPLLDGLAR